MNFYWLYFIIPSILYFACPIKKNFPLTLFWSLIMILSYDNVFDFQIYYDEFFFYKNGNLGEYTERGREPLWVLLNLIFSFTNYGIVLIHMLIMAFVVFFFYKYSKKLNVTNVSIFLFFLLNYIWKSDNTLRQDVAIVLGSYCIILILQKGKDLKKSDRLKIIAITFAAIGFHFSAFMLFPIYFLIKYCTKANFNIKLLFVVIVIFVYASQNQMIQTAIESMSLVFSLIGGDYGRYYVEKFSIIEFQANGLIGIFLSILSLSPLIYFKLYNKQEYENNLIVRTCVNISWIYVVWKNCISSDLFTRPVEYLSWFSLWGIAFMVNDIIKSLRKKINPVPVILCSAYLICWAWSFSGFISRYYGENNYMTVFSKECRELRIYDRLLQRIEPGTKRIR